MDSRAADNWWRDQPPERRIKIARWVGKLDAAGHPEVEGQYELPLDDPPRTTRSRTRRR